MLRTSWALELESPADVGLECGVYRALYPSSSFPAVLFAFVTAVPRTFYVCAAANRPHPAKKQPCFAEDDPRLSLAMDKVDPRIHFALVCGAKVSAASNRLAYEYYKSGFNIHVCISLHGP